MTPFFSLQDFPSLCVFNQIVGESTRLRIFLFFTKNEKCFIDTTPRSIYTQKNKKIKEKKVIDVIGNMRCDKNRDKKIGIDTIDASMYRCSKR